jgi:hypothetical protein
VNSINELKQVEQVTHCDENPLFGVLGFCVC